MTARDWAISIAYVVAGIIVVGAVYVVQPAPGPILQAGGGWVVGSALIIGSRWRRAGR